MKSTYTVFCAVADQPAHLPNVAFRIAKEHGTAQAIVTLSVDLAPVSSIEWLTRPAVIFKSPQPA